MPTFDLGKIIGPQGPQGEQGIQGIQGVQGVEGPAGVDGYTPNIQVGKVTTLSAGKGATVTRRPGSPDSAPVFDFGIPKGADAVNSGDMYKNIYDPTNKSQDIFSYVDSKIKEAGVTYTLSCLKSGTVFSLSGTNLPSSGYISCIFKADGDYLSGDNFQLNSSAYSIVTSDGEPMNDKAFISGSIVPVVLDQSNKTINFKVAGRKLTLSAGSYIMVQCFTENGTFTAPMTGKYRVTCIGKGGSGGTAVKEGMGIYLRGINGPGGGAGGAGQVMVSLEKGDSVSITANGNASFGSYISASAGEDGTIQHIGDAYSAIPGSSGSCNGITGTVYFSVVDASAGTNKVISESGTAQGGDGGSYNLSDSKFLSDEGGKGGNTDSSINGSTSVKPSQSGLFPFGTGGGGGAYQCYYTVIDATTTAYVPTCGKGAPGGRAAVIIEMAMD